MYFCFALLVLGAQDNVNVTPQGPDVRCGSYCLIVALRAVGVQVPSLYELESRLGKRGPLGYSLLQLQGAAEQYGIATVMSQTDLELLATRRTAFKERFACITLINESHFVCLYSDEGRSVRICDPPHSYSLDKIMFSKIWSHKVILLSDSPLAREEAIVRWHNLSRLLSNVAVGILTIIALALAIVYAKSWALRNRRLAGGAGFIGFTLCCVTPGCVTSNTKSPEPAVAGLVAKPQNHRIGLVVGKFQQTKTIDTILTNYSNTDIFVTDVIASCECTRAKLGKKHLRPGEATTLSSTIKLGETAEPRSSRVRLVSTDRSNPNIDVTFDWQVDSPIALPVQALRSSSSLKPNEARTERFPVNIKYLGLCTNCSFRIQTSSDRINATWLAASTPAEGHKIVNSIDTSSRLAGWISVEIQPQIEQMHFNDAITIELHCSGDIRARLTLPVTWAVESDINVIPHRIYLGRKKSGVEENINVLLVSKATVPFLIKEIHKNNDIITDCTIKDAVGQLSTVSLRVSFPETKGPWRETIQLTTSLKSEPTITVSVSGISE